jgi:hypothetical protein
MEMSGNLQTPTVLPLEVEVIIPVAVIRDSSVSKVIGYGLDN